jgi:hypothetical protein
VLLTPEGDHEFRQPDPEDRRAVKPGMASRADGNQPLAVVDTRSAVVNAEAAGGAARPAEMLVPFEDLTPESGEVVPGVQRRAVGTAAKAGLCRDVPSAGAEQGALPAEARIGWGRGQVRS